ncbi:uncharacterized protein I206_105285 [Kwoniella pini CBS 10737]|uniref:Uncharacterized protein n=1 Tax=Kwoniella pini CBS 10737 TaxID=1296096 RepID=A0A1B9I4P8_9TREE|nr:uncharacterized protein I206_03806 [Kwoniella pini CBS 10737]OCF50482.1 hypothetical protein I206_03806 [Kwoniella pini CBS 10737]
MSSQSQDIEITETDNREFDLQVQISAINYNGNDTGLEPITLGRLTTEGVFTFGKDTNRHGHLKAFHVLHKSGRSAESTVVRYECDPIDANRQYSCHLKEEIALDECFYVEDQIITFRKSFTGDTHQSRDMETEHGLIALKNYERPNLGIIYLKPNNRYSCPFYEFEPRRQVQRIGHSEYCFLTQTDTGSDGVDRTVNHVINMMVKPVVWAATQNHLELSKVSLHDLGSTSALAPAGYRKVFTWKFGPLLIHENDDKRELPDLDMNNIPYLEENGYHFWKIETDDKEQTITKITRSSGDFCDLFLCQLAEDGIDSGESKILDEFTCRADGMNYESSYLQLEGLQSVYLSNDERARAI